MRLPKVDNFWVLVIGSVTNGVAKVVSGCCSCTGRRPPFPPPVSKWMPVPSQWVLLLKVDKSSMASLMKNEVEDEECRMKRECRVPGKH